MDYAELERFLSKKVEHATTSIIGQSVLNRYIYMVAFDFSSSESVVIQAAMHAREHITCDLCVRLINKLSRDYERYKKMGMPNLYIVPMANPDGVELAINGLKSVKGAKQRAFLKGINQGADFSLFKANARGVDLNNNFDARWGRGNENVTSAAPHGYIGTSPMSEPETQALALLTMSVKPFFTISYHCKGQEIYYRFFNDPSNARRDMKIARLVKRATGYKIKNTEAYSSGGYKDWCVMRLKLSAVTIEVGSDKLSHPITIEHLDKIYKENRRILEILPRIKKVWEDDRARKIHETSHKAGKTRLQG